MSLPAVTPSTLPAPINMDAEQQKTLENRLSEYSQVNQAKAIHQMALSNNYATWANIAENLTQQAAALALCSLVACWFPNPMVTVNIQNKLLAAAGLFVTIDLFAAASTAKWRGNQNEHKVLAKLHASLADTHNVAPLTELIK